MADQISIDADALQAHATRMEALAGDVAEAVSAIDSINLSGGAFGVMCSFLVPLVQPVSKSTASLIAEGEKLLGRTGTELRGAVSDWAQVEQDLTSAIQALHKGMD